MASAAESVQVAQYMRITSAGKMKSYVEFALNFFNANPGQPLILHTLPVDYVKAITSSSTSADRDQNVMQTENTELTALRESDGTASSSKGDENRQPKSTPSTLNIPRLISIVEIIKREYLKATAPGLRSTGLYQYNYIGSLEDFQGKRLAAMARPAKSRAEEIIDALEGHKFIKQEWTPYMKVLLCTTAVDQISSEYTFQQPIAKKLSRAAKTRLRQRQKKERERNAKAMTES